MQWLSAPSAPCPPGERERPAGPSWEPGAARKDRGQEARHRLAANVPLPLNLNHIPSCIAIHHPKSCLLLIQSSPRGETP
jgi:hypothetical protein